MQREILFRAKRLDNREWVYGFYFEENHLGIIKAGITRYERLEGKDVSYEVDPETVCQFTGLLDKNGCRIYEGDIVSAWSGGYNHKGEIRWRLEGTPQIIIYPAFANQGFWSLHGTEHKEGKIFIGVDAKIQFSKGEKRIVDDGVEVIGTSHDNDTTTNQ